MHSNRRETVKELSIFSLRTDWNEQITLCDLNIISKIFTILKTISINSRFGTTSRVKKKQKRYKTSQQNNLFNPRLRGGCKIK